MKISKIASIAIVSSAAFLVGCGGGSSHHSSTKTVKIKASDAYVVSLPTPATLTVNGQTFTTENVKDGTITFTVPANVALDKPTFKVPGNAIVDTDGDGKLSPKDQVIRMPLETASAGSVANPIATAALARDDMKAYNVAHNFDPVQAKKDLILNPNNAKTKALVAVSDGIAFLAAEAKKKGKDPLKVVQAVNTDVIDELASNSNSAAVENVTSIVQQVVAPAATEAGVSADQVAQKVENVIKVIDTAAKAVKEGKVNPNQALVAVVAVSDANVNPEVVTQAIQTGNVEQVVNEIPENPEVAHVIEQHNNANNAAGNAQNNANNAAGNAQNNANNPAENAQNNGGGSSSSTNSQPTVSTPAGYPILNKTIYVESVKIGNKNEKLSKYNSHFVVRLPLHTNYSDYLNVKLNSKCDRNINFKATTTLNIINSNNKHLTITIPEEVQCVANQNPVTIIKKGTSIKISTNVESVENVIGGDFLSASVDKDLKNTDLQVNIDNIKNAVVQNSSKIEDIENTVNKYLDKNGTYKISINIEATNLGKSNITGTVIIGSGSTVNNNESKETSTTTNSEESQSNSTQTIETEE